MKILCTGALGHIGSLLINRLNHNIVATDNFLTQRYCSLFASDLYRSRVVFRELDILKDNIDVSGFDVVIHLAAITDASTSHQRRAETWFTNVVGTQRVAEACYKSGVRMVFPSTTSIYGKQSGLVDETCDELKPQSPYAESKWEAERWLGTSGVKHVILRFGTIYGTSPGMRFHTFVNQSCFNAALGRPVQVWRTALDQVRPYLFLEDAIAAIDHVMRNNLFDGQIYNVLSGNHTPRQILEQIKFHRPDMKMELVESEVMNQLSYYVSHDKLTKTGWKPYGNLAMGIGQTMALLQRIQGI